MNKLPRPVQRAERIYKTSYECTVSDTGWMCARVGNNWVPVTKLTPEQCREWREFTSARS